MKKLHVFILLMAMAAMAKADLVGLWKFDDAANLAKATIGQDLVLTGTQSAVAGVNAGDGAVQIGVDSNYLINSDAVANGGGSYLNQWTLVYDISTPRTRKYCSLLQTNPANNDDGDLFGRSTGKIGVNDLNYSAEGVYQADTWFRLVVRANLGSSVELWIDGVRVLQQTDTTKIPVDGRFSLGSQFVIFGDNDSEEDIVNASLVAFYDTALTDEELEGLGVVGTRLDNNAIAVNPGLNADGVLPTDSLQWKAPRDKNNPAQAEPATSSFIVYCDPNQSAVESATYADHNDVTYYSFQNLTGTIGTDPIQTMELSPDLAINTTYYWRVDTVFGQESEPNIAYTGEIWSFNTNQKPENAVVKDVMIKPATEPFGTLTCTAYDPANLGLNYRWYLDVDTTTTGDEVALTNGSVYQGCDTDALTVNTTGQPDQNNIYYVCEAYNASGNVFSNSARMVHGIMVNRYAFDGDLTDSNSGYNAAITTGTPVWTEGHVGNAISLSGDQAAIVDLNQFATAYPTTGQEFTITAWVKAEDISALSWASIIKHWNGSVSAGMFHFGLESSGTKLDLQIGQSNGSSVRITDGANFPKGSWQFVAAVADGSYIRLYRMGADEAISLRRFEVAATDYDGTVDVDTTRWVGIGCKPAAEGSAQAPGADGGAAGFWKGQLDDICVYNYGLSVEEIADIYGARVCLYSSDISSPYYMNTVCDLNTDCSIDLADFSIMATDWLSSGFYPAID
ncbi:MAG: LamG domain-containing protein [Sedimentisphaerales bacterium]|nr:LamG domain-containing protein [Sedimentisphaerales bacterium]MBN2842098.1 LamG domain-containing protein [Sedimentisphaerales bacterium]